MCGVAAPACQFGSPLRVQLYDHRDAVAADVEGDSYVQVTGSGRVEAHDRGVPVIGPSARMP